LVSVNNFNLPGNVTITVIVPTNTQAPSYGGDATPVSAVGYNNNPTINKMPFLETCDNFAAWSVTTDTYGTTYPSISDDGWHINIAAGSQDDIFLLTNLSGESSNNLVASKKFTFEIRLKIDTITTHSGIFFYIWFRDNPNYSIGVNDPYMSFCFSFRSTGLYCSNIKLADITTGHNQTWKFEINYIDYTGAEPGEADMARVMAMLGMTTEEFTAYMRSLVMGLPATACEYYTVMSYMLGFIASISVDNGSGFEYLGHKFVGPYNNIGDDTTVAGTIIIQNFVDYLSDSLDYTMGHIKVYEGSTDYSLCFPEISSAGTITVTTNPSPGDTLTIYNSVTTVFTFVDHYPNNSTEIQIGATTAATAVNIATRINAITGAEFIATVDDIVITVTAYVSTTFNMTTTSAGLTIGIIKNVNPLVFQESASVADSITVVEGGKATQENASVADSTDGLIDGLTESAGVFTMIDCLSDEMDEGIGATALSDNFDGLIEYMGEEIT
jgi:hypothetical protein